MRLANIWTFNGLVSVTVSHYAAFASNASGLMPPRYERLRLENRILKEDRDILKVAVQFFASQKS